MANENLEIIAAIGSVLGAIGGCWAAKVASDSASLAQNAAKRAEQTERRSLMRNLGELAQKIFEECNRSKSIAIDLKDQYRDLFIFAGQLESSREKMYLTGIDEKLQDVALIQDVVKKLIETHYNHNNASTDEELNLALIELEAKFVTVNGVRKELNRKLDQISAQNHQQRDSRINTKP